MTYSFITSLLTHIPSICFGLEIIFHEMNSCQICLVINDLLMTNLLTHIPSICFGLVIIFHEIELKYLLDVSSLCSCHRNHLQILSISLITQVGNKNADMKNIDVDVSVEFSRVTLSFGDNML
jgi:hypothetical protein